MSEQRLDRPENWDVVTPYERSDESPSSAIVRAVASVRDQDPLSLEPLYDVLDPDALDSLVVLEASTDVTLSFRYAGCMVWVDADIVAIDGRDEDLPA